MPAEGAFPRRLPIFLICAFMGSVSLAAVHPPEVTRHVIRHGQTLYSIARSYSVPLDQLVRVNGIKNPARIRAGRSLIIPGVASSTDRNEPTVSHASRAPFAPLTTTAPIATPAAPSPNATPARPAPHTTSGAPASPAATAAPALPAVPTMPAMPAMPTMKERGLDWPVEGTVLSHFMSPRRDHQHKGIDISSAQGTPIHAVAAGVVEIAADGYGAYGRLVAIQHDNGMTTYYGHNSKNLVREGQRVEAGEVIALVGHSGNAVGDHLHFEVHRNGQALDPLSVLEEPVRAAR